MLDIASKWVIFINGSFLKNGSETVREYEYDPGEPFRMGGWLEKHLNAYLIIGKRKKASKLIPLDLLMPIKEK